MKNKICPKCEKEKDISKFHKLTRNKNGVQSYCKLCRHILFQQNKDKKKEYDKIYAKKNTLKIRARKCKYVRDRKNKDIEYKLLCNLRNRLNLALKGNRKHKTTKTFLGCSFQEFKQYLENKFQKGMNWNNYGRGGWEIDHILPCSLFDLIKIEEQEKCFHYTNLQPLWAKINRKKSNKIV